MSTPDLVQNAAMPPTIQPAGLGWPADDVSRETPIAVGEEAGLGWPEDESS